jgi:hypothetical protein
MMARIKARLHEQQSGAALVWVAGSLVALLAMTALAVDLGWYYLNSTRVQRAADAAALAGVVYLPGFPASAQAEAENAAQANGLNPAGVTGTPVNDNQYQVTVAANVPMFFATVVGIDSLPLSRTATAEYIKPVPMGSPFSSFGYGYDSNQAFWAAIQAPYTALKHGDPYATKCKTTSSQGSCTGGSNPSYRPQGYWYGVDIPSGATSFVVEMYDAGFYDRTNFAETGDEESLVDSATGGADMHFQLYAPDATPSDPTDNTAIAGCKKDITSGGQSTTYKNKWVAVCSTINNPTPGIYPLQVWTTGNGGGSSHFALRVNAAGTTQERIYAINDMSIFTNDVSGSGTAYVYLAEISEVHAGKQLELRFFDPGEGSGNAYMTVYDPDDDIAACDWVATDINGSQTSNGSGNCRIRTTKNGAAQFDEQWITAVIDIPNDYTCGSDCWWYMELDLNTPHDRTTWEARVIGNPVHLVPNS